MTKWFSWVVVIIVMVLVSGGFFLLLIEHYLHGSILLIIGLSIPILNEIFERKK